MKFHRKRGGIFSFFKKKKTYNTRQLAEQENKVKKVLKKSFKKLLTTRMTVCYINKAVAKTTERQ